MAVIVINTEEALANVEIFSFSSPMSQPLQVSFSHSLQNSKNWFGSLDHLTRASLFLPFMQIQNS